MYTYFRLNKSIEQIFSMSSQNSNIIQKLLKFQIAEDCLRILSFDKIGLLPQFVYESNL
jgi:hypothetical protein